MIEQASLFGVSVTVPAPAKPVVPPPPPRPEPPRPSQAVQQLEGVTLPMTCAYPAHRGEGLDWVRAPQFGMMAAAVCGVCHPAPPAAGTMTDVRPPGILGGKGDEAS